MSALWKPKKDKRISSYEQTISGERDRIDEFVDVTFISLQLYARILTKYAYWRNSQTQIVAVAQNYHAIDMFLIDKEPFLIHPNGVQNSFFFDFLKARKYMMAHGDSHSSEGYLIGANMG